MEIENKTDKKICFFFLLFTSVDFKEADYETTGMLLYLCIQWYFFYPIYHSFLIAYVDCVVRFFFHLLFILETCWKKCWYDFFYVVTCDKFPFFFCVRYIKQIGKKSSKSLASIKKKHNSIYVFGWVFFLR